MPDPFGDPDVVAAANAYAVPALRIAVRDAIAQYRATLTDAERYVYDAIAKSVEHAILYGDGSA